MQNLIIYPQKDTPFVSFNATNHTLEISGESYHEHHEEFYRRVLDWLQQYVEEVQNDVTFIFRMTYFNTRTRFAFLEILQTLERLHANKGLLKQVIWYYDDDELEESGEFYQDQFIQLPFVLFEYPRGVHSFGLNS
ncbi:DUF1987 domain-containing protein [Microscilla marina]|uniref:SiaC family regulatory phosphoprotein domain-containing protein n=1 Tax=Microscilla marina ATCC 23134 TaxID=313606 RepID=A1ZC61_MICM2|nr:DUF1987 domain-containing protein [Microscilla marina]EAY31863.1 conserved hypothetical protein [Microscilla marina ATCC 23134]